MTVKRNTFLLIACVLAMAVMIVPSIALANAGVHGSFGLETDQCAGCHRAHTAPSATTWANNAGDPRSALLLGDYAELQDFCLTCHGDLAMGADTNVEGGVYEARNSTTHTYGTPGAALISGPFGVDWPTPDANNTYYKVDAFNKRVTSTHDYVGGTWAAWGGGVLGQSATTAYTGSLLPSAGVGTAQIKMDCGTCHDVHGSSNYRLLKDKVYGVTVGGYGAGPGFAPAPYVVSVERGFPPAGFALNTDYSSTYFPDYTATNYARPADGNQDKGMSGWCVGCHTFYMGKRADTGRGASIATTYTADTFFGKVVRHRHPVNVPLTNFDGPRATVANATLPLAHDPSTEAYNTKSNTRDDWVDCLTCHYSHGTTAVMSGYANIDDPRDIVADSGKGGVAPTDDSALLRTNNRNTCQACHNK